ncbi:PilZ domain-containing protein [Candidatus Ferrigenium straubiae]|jgi:hypothetical protein|uniref:PilZ domain-containing protein n=1 Tax=Candidatus Ferrigenium straubiae TaxID=2919506 RepID=UPI003F4AD9E2
MSKPDGNIIDPISGTPASQLPQHPKDSPAIQGSKEHRSMPRFFVKWRAIAFIDAQSQHHGFIKDISVKGAAVFLERNLQSLKLIKLHIHVPPAPTAKAPRVIEVYGKVVYTVYDNRELLFRAGISFLKFDSEHDPLFLENYLTNFQTRIP